MKKKIPDISRERILRKIALHLSHATIGSMHNPYSLYGGERTLRSMTNVECLVSLLEVEDCGSVGGFDFDMLHLFNWDKLRNHSLLDRFLMVATKYRQFPLLLKGDYSLSKAEWKRVFKLLESKISYERVIQLNNR